MAANLESLVSRLEAVTTRLESVASQGGTSEAGWCLFLLSARYICCLFNCSFLALIFSLFASFLPWVLFPTFGADVGVLVEHYDEVLCLKMFFSCYKMLEFIKGIRPSYSPFHRLCVIVPIHQILNNKLAAIVKLSGEIGGDVKTQVLFSLCTFVFTAPIIIEHHN